MGGGGAVRAAAKVAGVGVMNGGLCGNSPVVYLSSPKSTGSEDPFAADSVSALCQPASETKSCTIFGTTPASVPKPVMQAFKLLSGSPEAQTAVASIAADPNVWNAMMDNSVLKDFIQSQKKNDEFKEMRPAKQFEELSESSQTGKSETKSCTIFGTTPASVPKPVMQAFKLLSGSPEAQTAVASIAADPNVWNAMMDNSVLKDFIQSQKKNDEFKEMRPTKQFEELSESSQTGKSETKSCTIFGTTPASVPKPVMQAFKLLSGSPEAQTAVASIAADPNVWNAMMDNPVLKDFIQSQKRNDEFKEMRPAKQFKELSESSQTGKSEKRSLDIMDLMQNVKLTVLEMVGNVSHFFQNIFGFSAAESNSSDASGNTKATSMDWALVGSLMGLVLLVSMLVLLKRV